MGGAQSDVVDTEAGIASFSEKARGGTTEKTGGRRKE